MSVYDLESISGVLSRSAVTIGMFDGVHLGHRAILRALMEEAERIHGQSVVLTFDRHPAESLRPDKAPKLISTLDQKLACLEAAGADAIVVARFDREMSEMPAREFFERILLNTLKAAVVVVGPDLRFGKGRTGDFALAAELGMRHGVAAVAVPPVMIDEAPVSSTRIRSLLRHGHVEDAARLLGRPFVLEGEVVKGDGLGRRLGFPTANLAVDSRLITPGSGVYSADVVVRDEVYSCVVSIGSRPTVIGAKTEVIEAYILNFNRDIYGETIRIGFRSRLRDQKKFASLEKLVEQIRRDVDGIRTGDR